MKKTFLVFFIITSVFVFGFGIGHLTVVFPDFYLGHKIHLFFHNSTYSSICTYLEQCGVECEITFTGRGCGEGKECYRESKSDSILSIINDADIWFTSYSMEGCLIVDKKDIDNSPAGGLSGFLGFGYDNYQGIGYIYTIEDSLINDIHIYGDWYLRK